MATFEDALAASQELGFTGVGFAPRVEFNITILDFDHTLSEDVQSILSGTYVEYSPSDTGLHAFVIGNLGNHKSGMKDNPFGFETFASKGYVTFTGRPTETTDITDSCDSITTPSAELITLYNARFGNVKSETFSPIKSIVGLSQTQVALCLSAIPADIDYDNWLKVGMALHHETQGAAHGFALWDSWSAQCPGKYNTIRFNQHKWESFGRYTDTPVTGYSLVNLANQYGANIDLSVAPDEDFEAIPDDILPVQTYFKVVSDLEFCRNITPVSWLIKGVLPKSTVGVIYGESGSGKSFLVLDMCAAIVRNIPWNGFKTRGAGRRVLYVIAEGVNGFPHRLEAYRIKEGLVGKDIGIDIVQDTMLNLTKHGNAARLVNDFKILGQYDLIVIDTLAQVTPGINESSSEDMGLALDHCKKISRASGAMILIVHHSGKDASKGMRGHSSVLGASDAIFEVTRFGEDRAFKIIKLKEGKEGEEFGFKLQTKVIGYAPIEEGEDEPDVIESCVVEYCEIVKPVKKMELKSNQKVVFDVLSEVSQGAWITRNNLIELCVERVPKDENGRDVRKQNVIRAINSGVGKFIEQNENGEYRVIL